MKAAADDASAREDRGANTWVRSDLKAMAERRLLKLYQEGLNEAELERLRWRIYHCQAFTPDYSS
jgi:hypothetical protein